MFGTEPEMDIGNGYIVPQQRWWSVTLIDLMIY